MDSKPANPEPPPTLSAKVVYEIVYTQDYVMKLRQHRRRLRRGRALTTVWRAFAYVSLGGLAIFELWLKPRHWKIDLAVLVFLSYSALSPLINHWSVARRWRRSRFCGARSRLELSSDGLHSVGQYGDGNRRWTAFVSARRFPDGFLLLIDRRVVSTWLPHAALLAGTVEEAAQLISAHVADYKEA